MRPLKMVTFNLRCVWLGDGVNSFVHRAGMILDKMDSCQPDVVCFQEAPECHARFLEKHLPEYQLIYHGRKADRDGEGLALALRRESVELLSLDCFWLSPTPYVPGSRYADQSNCPRICQILTFRLKGTQGPMRVYNIHLDHISDSARVLGIRQVLERVREENAKAQMPAFLMGDFNATPGSETIRYLYEYEPFPVRELTDKVDLTFHNFGRISEHYRIDYIFADALTAQRPYTVTPWTEEEDGIFLSDHYPLELQMQLD